MNRNRLNKVQSTLLKALLIIVIFVVQRTAYAMLNVPQGPTSFSDPPLFLTNLSGTTATVVWQTVLPNRALSPQRSTVLEANTQAQPLEQGFFLLFDHDEPKQISNVLFVSILHDDGSFVMQKPFKIDETLDLERLHKMGINIVIEADGGLIVSARQY